jgi:hypothetical protein
LWRLPVVYFHLVKLDAQGKLSVPEPLEGTHSRSYDVAWEALPDLWRIEAFTISDGGTKSLVARHTFDPKTGH